MAAVMLTAYEVEDAQEMLNGVEQMKRRLVAMRLANSHETTPHEEARA